MPFSDSSANSIPGRRLVSGCFADYSTTCIHCLQNKPCSTSSREASQLQVFFSALLIEGCIVLRAPLTSVPFQPALRLPPLLAPDSILISQDATTSGGASGPVLQPPPAEHRQHQHHQQALRRSVPLSASVNDVAALGNWKPHHRDVVNPPNPTLQVPLVLSVPPPPLLLLLPLLPPLLPLPVTVSVIMMVLPLAAPLLPAVCCGTPPRQRVAAIIPTTTVMMIASSETPAVQDGGRRPL